MMFPRHPADDSSKLHNMSLLMSELCFFLCFKLFSANFAIVHAQEKIVMFIRIGHTCVS